MSTMVGKPVSRVDAYDKVTGARSIMRTGCPPGLCICG